MAELILRIILILLGVWAGTFVLLVRRATRLGRGNTTVRHESLRTLGGAALCFTVSLGVLATGLGIDPALRLPMVGVALAWIAVGATRQYMDMRRN